MTHAFYIGMSYAATGLVVLCLIAWVVFDGQARKRELKALEASGVRRRTKAGSAGDAP
ncbi:heme exporter protein CcmD [Rhizobium oryzihabitans]|mgnify:CR=1 FL=1|uniref:Heme exporter protein D n=1 Tax=Rhizobium oryzihabitans TaxID=2267833 RepID=A0A7L5BIV4_9HYPH|nr:heme exporter protein CcmD [Rhizobium oryzihabitans]QCM05953.1 heme exporter protein CcmD [Agrobacterium tumefaciens]QIB38683.1 heme exporter protein CcmD [Rhizobium oryzihabitans]CUX34059.1 Heme exporter protein D [Agrobacterium genomosp. 5 str. CFBP 6626]